MSPSVNKLTEQIGRDVEEGDILIKTYGISGIVESYEVMIPHVNGKPNKLMRLLGVKEQDCVKVGFLAEWGRLEGETRLFSRAQDLWRYIILRENRTDRPSLRER